MATFIDIHINICRSNKTLDELRDDMIKIFNIDVKDKCRKKKHVMVRLLFIKNAFMAKYSPLDIANYLELDRTGIYIIRQKLPFENLEIYEKSYNHFKDYTIPKRVKKRRIMLRPIMNLETKEIYPSVREASKAVGLGMNAIYAHTSGRFIKDIKWKYVL